QVMVRVRGPVKAGDYIVASGLNDGTGIAVSPERITSEQFEQAVGQAWESSADLGVKSVRTAVGLLRRDPTVTRLVDANRRQAKQIKALSDQLTTLESVMKKELAALKFLASSKKKTIGQRASAQSQGRRRAKRSALPKV
ncbi:MAG TPA: hypothetical protein VFP47_04620, partial [Pyrinomonadaceae bacterium]|nr:hypothetical protein [Pyrinomonadaceae bacterium]